MKKYTFEVKKWLIYEVDASDKESALKRLCDDFDLAPTDEGFDADAFLKADLLEVEEIKKEK
jgi:hypothetical protein